MRPHYSAPTELLRASGDGSGAKSGATRHAAARASTERPALRLMTKTGSMLAAILAVLALAAPAEAPIAGTSVAWPSKGDARRVAVRATAATCRTVAWCTGYDVVPAHRCRRAEHRTVYCAIAFITAQRQRCGGVVGVSRTRRGRLDQVMAVPLNCSADQPPGGNSAPTKID
jgi:hypothetical protein